MPRLPKLSASRRTMATLAAPASKKPAPRRRLGTVLGIALPVSVALVSLVLLGRRRRKARRQQHRVAAAQERQVRQLGPRFVEIPR